MKKSQIATILFCLLPTLGWAEPNDLAQPPVQPGVTNTPIPESAVSAAQPVIEEKIIVSHKGELPTELGDLSRNTFLIFRDMPDAVSKEIRLSLETKGWRLATSAETADRTMTVSGIYKSLPGNDAKKIGYQDLGNVSFTQALGTTYDNSDKPAADTTSAKSADSRLSSDAAITGGVGQIAANSGVASAGSAGLVGFGIALLVDVVRNVVSNSTHSPAFSPLRFIDTATYQISFDDNHTSAKDGTGVVSFSVLAKRYITGAQGSASSLVHRATTELVNNL